MCACNADTSSGAYETGAGSSRPMASSASCPRRASCHAPQAEALADLPHQEPPSASAGHSRQHGPAEAAEEAALGSLQEDEGMCVICMAEPRQCGYLVSAAAVLLHTLHATTYLVRAAAHTACVRGGGQHGSSATDA